MTLGDEELCALSVAHDLLDVAMGRSRWNPVLTRETLDAYMDSVKY